MAGFFYGNSVVTVLPLFFLRHFGVPCDHSHRRVLLVAPQRLCLLGVHVEGSPYWVLFSSFWQLTAVPFAEAFGELSLGIMLGSVVCSCFGFLVFKWGRFASVHFEFTCIFCDRGGSGFWGRLGLALGLLCARQRPFCPGFLAPRLRRLLLRSGFSDGSSWWPSASLVSSADYLRFLLLFLPSPALATMASSLGLVLSSSCTVSWRSPSDWSAADALTRLRRVCAPFQVR